MYTRTDRTPVKDARVLSDNTKHFSGSEINAAASSLKVAEFREIKVKKSVKNGGKRTGKAKLESIAEKWEKCLR